MEEPRLIYHLDGPVRRLSATHDIPVPRELPSHKKSRWGRGVLRQYIRGWGQMAGQIFDDYAYYQYEPVEFGDREEFIEMFADNDDFAQRVYDEYVTYRECLLEMYKDIERLKRDIRSPRVQGHLKQALEHRLSIVRGSLVAYADHEVQNFEIKWMPVRNDNKVFFTYP